MEKFQQKGFFDFLKRNLIAIITPILSLLALVFSVVQSFLAHSRTSIIILFVIGTFFLIVYNVWITIATRQLSLDPSQKRRQFGKRFKLTMYIASTLIFILCWSAFGLVSSHKHFGHILFSLGKYKQAGQHFNKLSESKRDFRVYIELAQCEEAIGNHKKSIEYLEHILEDERILKQINESDKSRKLAKVHFYISIILIRDDIEGIKNAEQKVYGHLEKIRLLEGDSPFLSVMLADIKAKNVIKYQSNELDNKELRIDKIFSEAKETIERFEQELEDYYETMAVYHFCFARALSLISKHDRAKEEYDSGLAFLNKFNENVRIGSIEIVSRDTFYFHLGNNELDIDNSPEAIERAFIFWGKISSQDMYGAVATMAASTYYDQGIIAEEQGNQVEAKDKFDTALKLLSVALKRGERTKLCYYLLGCLYFEKEDFINSAFNFEEYVKIDPSNPDGFYQLGLSKRFIGEKSYEEAREAFEEAIRLDPFHASAHFELGDILYFFKEYEESLVEFEKSISIDENQIEPYLFSVYSLLNLYHEEQKSSEERISILEKALNYFNIGLEKAESLEYSLQLSKMITVIQESQLEIWTNLAFEYVEQKKNLQIALQYIEKALKSEPNDPNYLDTKAWILVNMAEQSEDFTPSQKQKKYDEAEKILKQCLNDYTEDDKLLIAETLFHLGYIEKLRGKYDKAQEFFLKVIELDSQHEKTKKELNLLKK